MKLRYAFIIIIIVGMALRLMLMQNYSFPLTMDHARDLIDIRKIVVELHPPLIGQVTSMPGLFHGPFWYYFNVLPFVFGNGNPSALVYWLILWYFIATIVIVRTLQKKDTPLAFVSTLLFLFHPTLLYSGRHALNPNIIPVVAVFYILLLANFISAKTLLKALLLGLLAGIALQVEVGFGVLYFPFLLAIMWQQKSGVKNILYAVFGFGITLIPQFIFELRHNFLMTNAFIHEMFGSGNALGDSFTIAERFQSHFASYLEVIAHSLIFPPILNYLLFVIAVIVLFKKPTSKYFTLPFSFIVFSFVLYLLYPYALKGWFLLSLYVFVMFIFAVFFTKLLKSNDLLIKFISVVLITISVVGSFWLHWNYARQEMELSSDPSVLRNEIAAIDWVYQKANGEAFKVYNYMPSVIDYPYQYLFWWYGEKEYGYHPDTVAYLENVPPYIENKDEYLTHKKVVGETYPTFLIIEPDEKPERIELWLNNFNNLCIVDSHVFPWGTEIQERVECNSPTSSATTTKSSS